MRALKNPHTQKVSTVYGPMGNGSVYEIGAGETLHFPEELYPVADHFLEIAGFLKEVETAETKKFKRVQEVVCQYCGRDCKTKLAHKKHEKKCKEEYKKDTSPKIIKPTGKVVARNINRSQKENQDFKSTDMQGIADGKGVEEEVGGRKQKIVYDRDGVGWYGPGVQEDRVPTGGLRKKRPGQFN